MQSVVSKNSLSLSLSLYIYIYIYIYIKPRSLNSRHSSSAFSVPLEGSTGTLPTFSRIFRLLYRIEILDLEGRRKNIYEVMDK